MATPLAPAFNGSAIHSHDRGMNGYSLSHHRKAVPDRSPAPNRPSPLAIGQTPPEGKFDNSRSHTHANSVPMAFWDGSEQNGHHQSRSFGQYSPVPLERSDNSASTAWKADGYNARSYSHNLGHAQISGRGDIYPSHGSMLPAKRNPPEHIQSLYDL